MSVSLESGEDFRKREKKALSKMRRGSRREHRKPKDAEAVVQRVYAKTNFLKKNFQKVANG